MMIDVNSNCSQLIIDLRKAGRNSWADRLRAIKGEYQREFEDLKEATPKVVEKWIDKPTAKGWLRNLLRRK